MTATADELSPDAVLSFAEWLKLTGISKQTGLRLRAKGEAPRFVQLSPSRIGTTVAEYRAWLASRNEAECRYEGHEPKRKRA
jgi:predicted DNA-binding transcriptional regulator AlpA